MRDLLLKIANSDVYKKSIIIIRHAEKHIAEEFKNDSHQLLTETGKEQAIDLANHIKKIGFRIDYISSSPISRCVETAKVIANGCNCEMKVVDALASDVRGVYVYDQERADSNFVNTEPLEVLVKMQTEKDTLPGMVDNKKGTEVLLKIFLKNFESSNGNLLCITHDSILALFTNFLTNEIIDGNNWFGYLEGVVLTMAFNNKFQLHWSDRTFDITDKVRLLVNPAHGKISSLFESEIPVDHKVEEDSLDTSAVNLKFT